MDAVMLYKRSDRNYMIRSSKRPGLTQKSARKRKKRPNRHWLYKLITILMLIVCCPVGLVMLWLRRPIRWQATTKLLLSLCSLVLCFVLLTVGLLYDFRDPTAQRLQQKANLALESAHQFTQRVNARIGENWRAVMDNRAEIAGAAGDQALGALLEVIASPTPVPTPTPEPTPTPAPTPTPKPPFGQRVLDASYDHHIVARATPEPTATPTPEPTFTPEPTAKPTAAPDAALTAAPTAEPPRAAQPDPNAATPAQRPTPTPETTLFASVTPTPTPSPSPTLAATATPAPTAARDRSATVVPTASPEPTVDPALIPALRPAGEITVWHTANGKWYHARATCDAVTGAQPDTLADAAAARLSECPTCKPVSRAALALENPVYLSADGRWHIDFDCEAAGEGWTVAPLDEARANKDLAPCERCGAVYYVDGVPLYHAGNLPPIDVPTAAPGTGNGAPAGTITNAETLVYVNDRNGSYHRGSTCVGAAGLALQPTHLSDALRGGKTPCTICNPPEPIPAE